MQYLRDSEESRIIDVVSAICSECYELAQYMLAQPLTKDGFDASLAVGYSSISRLTCH